MNLAWLDACFVIAITAHEFSHAFAGHLVGFRIFRVIIGTGRTWWRGSLFGFDVEAKAFPFSGVTLGTPREWEQTPWKLAFFIFAGPLANACLLGLVILLKGPVWNAYTRDGFNGWLVFALANFITVFISLWPQTYQTALGLLRSDGLVLLRLLRGKQRRGLLEDTHAAWCRLEAAVCTEQRRHAEARSWLERGLAVHPKNWLLRDSHAVSLIAAGEYLAARSAAVSLLAEIPAQDARRLGLLNNIAYVDALLDDPALLDEADRYSTEALASLPWHPALKNTRGVVLLALNRLDEALPLLQESANVPDRTPESRAECLCALAMTEARQGNLTSAERNLAAARQTDPQCFLLPRTEDVLANIKSPKSATVSAVEVSPA